MVMIYRVRSIKNNVQYLYRHFLDQPEVICALSLFIRYFL